MYHHFSGHWRVMKTINPLNTPIEEPASIQKMFNEIAPTYDLLNHFLSFGLDIRWRKKAIKLLKEKEGGILDRKSVV
jgi:demethylmenaquinone methyltransferase/2-methoxy-6-polyprenyl-1,4-benzoquinol methylase